MQLRIARNALAAALAGFALAACSPGEPGDPVDLTSSTTQPEPPQRVEVDFDGLSLSLEVPGRFGKGSATSRESDKCTHQQYGWGYIPSGADDDSELLFVASTTKPCPDEQAVNGRFPTWAFTGDLPDGAEPVDTALGEGHRFSLSYTQCTNECYDRTYDVVFVELPDKRSFWIQSSDVDSDTIDAMLESVRVE